MAIPGVSGLLSRRRDKKTITYDARQLAAISRGIRVHLDSARVIRATVGELHRTFPTSSVSIWLTRGGETPQLACSSTPGGDEAVPVPRVVVRAARHRRLVHESPAGRAARLAAPIVAPRSGLVGVLLFELEQMEEGQRCFVEALADEAGFAIETANLYEVAVSRQEKSEAILGHVASAIVVTDLKGRIREWNQAAEAIIGVPAAQATRSTCAKVLGLGRGERRLDCTQGCALLLAGHGSDSTLGIEAWRYREDGRKQPLLATVSVVTDADGNVSEVVHSLRDVTRLKEADEAKTLFLATASHELKTPLTVIQGFAQLLAASRYSDEGERKEALETIVRRAKQLTGIVDRVLLSSGIEAGRAEVRPRDLDIVRILAERADAVRTVTGRSILLAMAEDLPDVSADPDAMATVIDHLLENAIKYSPDGGDVDVRTEFDEHYVRVIVSDHGIGMYPDQLERCFEKFWQAESTDVRRFGGTGIGLYIVRSLVQAMGGDVRAESAPGQGSTLTVSLLRFGVTPPKPPEPAIALGVGEPSMVREFMRQLGIPTRRVP